MNISPQIDIEDDYDHPDESIEYIIECIPYTPRKDEDDDENEFSKLQEEYSTLFMNSCYCSQASACGSTFSPFTSGACTHAGNYRTYTHIDQTTELILNRSRPAQDVIFECSSLCSCRAGVCQNRLVQYGPRKHLQIVDSHYLNGQKGLITTKFIPRGGFICEYAGELLTRTEAKRREMLSGINDNSLNQDEDDSYVDDSIDDYNFAYQRNGNESNDDDNSNMIETHELENHLKNNDNENYNENDQNDLHNYENSNKNGINDVNVEDNVKDVKDNDDAYEVNDGDVDDDDDDDEDINDKIDDNDKTISSSSMDFERSYNKNKMNYVMCLNEYSFESLRHLTGNKSTSMPLEVDENYDENSVMKPIQTIIDPSQKGNIGRYLNHSCEPNCEILSVRIDCPIPKVAFFAKRNIQPFDELTFHYAGGAIASAELKGYKNLSLCYCGAKTCQLYLPNLAY